MRAIKFFISNASYIIWFVTYFYIAWFVLGLTLNNFFIVLLIYSVSITVALSPIGEAILQITENCRLPSTEQEKNYLLPMFEEVYQEAKELNPKLSNGIRIYIMDAMYVNAFAMGRKTIAVTRGAIETFTADELKGVIAHELGHITHGHTKALLLSLIGNFFFTVIVWIFRLLFVICHFISELVAQFTWMGWMFSIMTFIMQITVNIFVFVFVNLSELILSSNSRVQEFQADKFAYEIGYGRELTAGLYLLQKISINRKLSLNEKMRATHPHLARRIETLERLESQAI